MSRRTKGLLAEIEKGALDEQTPISVLLRKCVMLGGRAGSADLRDWARRELNGYTPGGEVELPDYRIVMGQICVDGMTMRHQIKGEPISSMDLPTIAQEQGIDEQVRLYGSIGELEDIARGRKEYVDLALPGAALLVKLMNHERADQPNRVASVYWRVSTIAFRGVVEQLRNTLVELVAELVATTPDEQMPTSDAADQAVNVVLHGGKRNHVTVVNAQSGTGPATAGPPAAPEDSAWIRWRKRGIFVGLSTIAAAVLAAVTWLDWQPWK